MNKLSGKNYEEVKGIMFFVLSNVESYLKENSADKIAILYW